MKQAPRHKVVRLLHEGLGPTAIARRIRKEDGIEVTASAISNIRRRHTNLPPMQAAKARRMPWRIDPAHQNSRYRYAILAWVRRERDEPLGEEAYLRLMRMETELKESGKVIDYYPGSGWRVVPARPGIDLGIVREPDDKPRPATRGPYAMQDR